MEGSRLHILCFVQRRSRATVEQLSRHMGLASATVRRHLDILQRDHLVTFQQVKKKTGRPQYTYYLTEEGQESLPKGYNRLLGGLLQELSYLSRAEVRNRSGADLLQALFQRMAQRTAVAAEQDPEHSFAERVAKAVAVLEQEKYQPEVEQLTDSVRIHLYNCPYRSVSLENPSICTYDHALLSAILGTSVRLEHCIRQEDECCCYVASIVA
ncbi:helix-turn-helix transcriptional regulator [Chloroflexota bacterium]